jgi:hypothetical protein
MINKDELQRANKGEWSELYVFFKILNERKIAAANNDLLPIAGKDYIFTKVIREETLGNKLEYILNAENQVSIMDTNGVLLKVIETRSLKDKTKKIFQAIKAGQGSTFELDELSDLTQEYLIEKIKAGSLEKTDLLAVISDERTLGNQLGFSIKSHVGGAPTLINASKHTDFIFEIENFNGDINAINSITGGRKVRDRISAIFNSGAKIKFVDVSSGTFKSNLRYSDSMFSLILANMLLDYYSDKGSDWDRLISLAAEKVEFDMPKQELKYKVQNFLRSAALGMVPSRQWDTKLSSYGGYIVVLNNGDLVCYSLFNDDEFKDYLTNNTKFDTPSTTRYQTGDLYTENGKILMKLNLQIRFLK